MKRLLGDASIVRHRGKIESTINNAKRARERRGFSFVGPITMYALMQAMGMVNDHLEGCAARERVEAARATLARPGIRIS